MFVLGTAGHVDHGKSSLLKRLTLGEPDRLPEEKLRGMTIELNFVHFKSQQFGEVGIVDVPGHQKLVKTFVSGVSGFDAFIFCVAADDGWMPQSEEHLRVLEGLGVTRGILIITKVDLVDEARRVAVSDEASCRIRERLKHPVDVCCSGFDQKLANVGSAATPTQNISRAVERLLSTLAAPRNRGTPRVWVDRVFSPKGQGVVVTGTLKEGSLSVGDLLAVLPSGLGCEVRGLESYGESKSKVCPNARVAIQLSGIGLVDITRGELLVSRGASKTSRLTGGFASSASSPPITKAFDARINWLVRSAPKRAWLTCCMGTWHGACLVIELNAPFYRLKTAPLGLRFGDTFILRRPGGEETIAVGTVLDPDPTRRHLDALPLVSRVDSVESYLELCLEKSKWVCLRDFESKTDRARTEVEAIVSNLKRVKDWVLKPDLWKTWEKDVLERIGSETRTIIALAHAMSIPQEFAEVLCAELESGGRIRKSASGFAVRGLDTPNPFALSLVVGLPVKISDLTRGDGGLSKCLDRLIQEGLVVGLGEWVMDLTTFKRMVTSVTQHLGAREMATTSELKTLIGVSRNHAVLILERMDRGRVTYLKDGIRRLLKAGPRQSTDAVV